MLFLLIFGVFGLSGAMNAAEKTHRIVDMQSIAAFTLLIFLLAILAAMVKGPEDALIYG